MTQEEKQLLIKDLCARLPYEVKGLHRNEVQRLLIMDSFGSYQVNGYDAWFSLGSVEFKPYLRPMSSMTEEEFKKWRKLVDLRREPTKDIFDTAILSLKNIDEVTDWLNEHHFDYRGLIPMGLALEAPADMYK